MAFQLSLECLLCDCPDIDQDRSNRVPNFFCPLYLQRPLKFPDGNDILTDQHITELTDTVRSSIKEQTLVKHKAACSLFSDNCQDTGSLTQTNDLNDVP